MPTDPTLELSKLYDPGQIEAAVSERWLAHKSFAATPDARPESERFVVMMPLPNVTGALHLGHAMDNVMQDLLARWHRMRGHNTLWQPGTDHAGIATQAVVERRLFELEKKTRHDIGREALVARIWAWKDEYQARIVRQQRQMGCSCDWDRQRFTMDPVCSAAVREAFFRLFADKLIFRGKRLVNWDCQLQTAVADDEVYHDLVNGHFYHLKYPVIDPAPGEPTHVVVATTRPETMLGDTGVACHPEPGAALDRLIAKLERDLAKANAAERAAKEAELAAVRERKATALPLLEQLAGMARAGRMLRHPLLGRDIPLVADEWAKPELGSGCVKLTPAHDPNDYLVWQRQAGKIGIINLLEPDGRYGAVAGPYAGIDRFLVRERVVADLQKLGLVHAIEPREIEIGHSDRSKTPIEPYLSLQWFVKMDDVHGGIACGAGTAKAFRHPAGLAQLAIDAASGTWSSPSGRRVAFHPDGDRYGRTYAAWLGEKRDWCISRQLWWGHRISVWRGSFADALALARAAAALPKDPTALVAWVGEESGEMHALEAGLALAKRHPERGPFELLVCLRDEAADARHALALEKLGLPRDPDVLDTWFSSALWPLSTLGWPDPARAAIGPGQASLAREPGRPDSLAYYYPGSCLVTGRDILTLWVARMVLMGLYLEGDVPFTDVFLHAKILDGKGETMSKTKGNGVDPADILERYGTDAMRYCICELQTGLQDVRLPVQADCPSCGKPAELALARQHKGQGVYDCPACTKPFDVLAMSPGVPRTTPYSDRFDVGRAFANKLWNAARFALGNIGTLSPFPLAPQDLESEDRWLLSRLAATIAEVDLHLGEYNPAAALGAARDFFWNTYCDWYLELVKPRVRDASRSGVARQLLAFALDRILRLLHPFVPFITEHLWEALGRQAPVRGLFTLEPAEPLLVGARWPLGDPAWVDGAVERRYAILQPAVRALRDLRARHNVPPKKALPAAIRTTSPEVLAALTDLARHVESLVALESLAIGPSAAIPPNAAMAVGEGYEIHVGSVLDPAVERARLTKRQAELEGQIGGTKKRLENPGFLAKAKPEVVAAERAKVAELEQQLGQVVSALAALK